MISIVIPIHNLGSNGNDKLLRRCLDSIIAQTYKDFEVLLMENGSTDNTIEILREYIDKDNRFKLHILNVKGVSNARNAGIKLALGEYITFIDGDDFISEDYLKSLYKPFQTDKGIDMVCCSASFIYPNNSIKSFLKLDNNIFYSTNINHNISTYICSRLIKTDLIISNNISFNTSLKNGEDTLFVTEVFLLANKIITISDGMYYYQQNRKGQATHDESKNYLYSIDKYNAIYNLYKKYGLVEKEKEYLNNFFLSLFIGSKFARTPITRMSYKDIRKFVVNNKKIILEYTIPNDIECKIWQRVWFRRFQKAVENNYTFLFVRIMRFLKNFVKYE